MASNYPKKTKTVRKNGQVSDRFGAPTTFRDEYCERLVAHMARGFSFYSFAAQIDSDEATILGWTEKFEHFARARAIGTTKRREFYEKAGHALMMGQMKTVTEEEYARDSEGNVIFRDGKPVIARQKYTPTKGDSKPWALTMKNAFGMTDTVTVRFKNAATEFKDPAEMSDDEIRDELKRLRANLPE